MSRNKRKDSIPIKFIPTSSLLLKQINDDNSNLITTDNKTNKSFEFKQQV